MRGGGLFTAIGGIAVAALCAIPAPGTAGDRTPAADARQSATLRFTSARPGAPTGLDYAADWFDPANPEGKPYSVKTIVLELAPGSVRDTSVPARCTATDAELIAIGAAACPAASKIGEGELITDTGSPGVIPRYGTNQVTSFNAADEVINLAESQDPPTRVVSRGRIEGDTVTFDIPAVPGNAPPDPYLAFRHQTLAGPPIVTAAGAALRTPPRCPADGEWTNRLTFVYRDDVSQTVESPSPCHADRREPRIDVSGVPRHRCAAHGFDLAVRIRDASGLRVTNVRIDGERIRSTSRNRFRQHVSVRRLEPGGHTISIVARDVAGNRGAARNKFGRCG
jgi:hypothetical protein